MLSTKGKGTFPEPCSAGFAERLPHVVKREGGHQARERKSVSVASRRIVDGRNKGKVAGRRRTDFLVPAVKPKFVTARSGGKTTKWKEYPWITLKTKEKGVRGNNFGAKAAERSGRRGERESREKKGNRPLLLSLGGKKKPRGHRGGLEKAMIAFLMRKGGKCTTKQGEGLHLRPRPSGQGDKLPRRALRVALTAILNGGKKG